MPGPMARRIDVTGAGGVRLAAWEFGDPPKTDHRTHDTASGDAAPADPARGSAAYGAGDLPGVLCCTA